MWLLKDNTWKENDNQWVGENAHKADKTLIKEHIF
jgi:hypothetical protein